MEKRDEEVINQLKKALLHLEEATNITVQALKENPASKKVIGVIWEEFLSTFFGKIKAKGKANNVNLLGLISLPKLWKL